MADIPGYRSPLQGLVGNEALGLEERARVGKVVFRGEPEKAVREMFRKATGAALPTEPNTTKSAGDNLVLWLGPNEWMVHCPEAAVSTLAESLAGAKDGLHTAAVDVSAYYTVIRIGGPHALDALAHGCPLDTHPSVLKAGHCAQTRFDTAAILLHKIDESPLLDIQVRWSFAEHVWNLLHLLGEELADPATDEKPETQAQDT